MAEFKTETDGKKLKITISGNIVNDENFIEISRDIKEVSLEFSDMGYINSTGVRVWLNWKDKYLEFTDLTINLEKCPKSFIDQLNLMHSLLPTHTKINSFFVPYFIEETGDLHNLLFRKDEEFIGDQVKYDEEITVEGKSAEIDVNPDSYFSFLSYFI